MMVEPNECPSITFSFMKDANDFQIQYRHGAFLHHFVRVHFTEGWRFFDSIKTCSINFTKPVRSIKQI
ncbi:hypothetical protein L103DPR2_01773 [Limnohabitans sp. 103DPR2]|nr:hypothetical protein L103DPR2_01773 [Limnohabitans sp. 103DPR2]